MQFKDIQFYDGVSEYFDKMKKTISLYKRVYLFGAARGDCPKTPNNLT